MWTLLYEMFWPHSISIIVPTDYCAAGRSMLVAGVKMLVGVKIVAVLLRVCL